MEKFNFESFLNSLEIIHFVIVFLVLFIVFLISSKSKIKKTLKNVSDEKQKSDEKILQQKQYVEKSRRTEQSHLKAIEELTQEKHGFILYLKTINQYSLFQRVEDRAKKIAQFSDSSQDEQTEMLNSAIKREVEKFEEKVEHSKPANVELKDELNLRSATPVDTHEDDIPSIHVEKEEILIEELIVGTGGDSDEIDDQIHQFEVKNLDDK